MNTVEIATKEVLMHHLTAFGNNNLDGIMLDYSAQSTLLTDKGAITGLDTIRQFFEEMFALIPTGSHFEMKQLTISNNVAHIIWVSKSATAYIPFGTDTFVIENGKIIMHTVCALIK